MKAALPRVPAKLRAQMQEASKGWRGEDRAALLLLDAQKKAAFDVCDWLLVDSLRCARFCLFSQLADRAMAEITEGIHMHFAHEVYPPVAHAPQTNDQLQEVPA